MNEIASKTVSPQKSGRFFCTFLIAGEEFALPLQCIQEVVAWPDSIVKMPQAASYLCGMFYLRDIAVPVVDLSILFEMSEKDASKDRRIAILNIDGSCLGLVFDSTGEVQDFRNDIKTDFGPPKSTKHALVAGAIKSSNKNRTIQILDPKSLLSAVDIPNIALQSSSASFRKERSSRGEDRMRCISFRIANAQFAFEIAAIHEIIDGQEIVPDATTSSLCLGTANLRGRKVPVINSCEFFGVSGSKSAISDRKVVVLRKDNWVVGLAADSVDEIKTYTQSNLVPAPDLPGFKLPLLQGCLAFPNEQEVVLLSFDGFFKQELVNFLGRIYESVVDDDTHLAHSVSQKGEKGSRQNYVLFWVKHLFGLSSEVVKEVIEYPKSILPTPDAPVYIHGLHNLRGILIPLIDLSALFGAPVIDFESRKTKKIVIASVGKTRIGLIADSLEGILPVRDSEKRPLPDLMKDAVSRDFCGASNEGYYVNSPGGKTCAFSVLNLSTIAARLGAQSD